jgi:regulator of replication initiation timing
MTVNADLLFKIAKLQRDVDTLHSAVSDLAAKNLRLLEENKALKQQLSVAIERS